MQPLPNSAIVYLLLVDLLLAADRASQLLAVKAALGNPAALNNWISGTEPCAGWAGESM